MVKNPPDNSGDARDSGLAAASGSCPGGENGYPLQYSSLEYPMDRGLWQATIHGVAKESELMRDREPLKEHLGIFQRYANLLPCTCLQWHSSFDELRGSSRWEHLWAQGILFLAYSSGGNASVSKRLCNIEHSLFCTNSNESRREWRGKWLETDPGPPQYNGAFMLHAPLGTTAHIFLNKQAYCWSNKVIYGEKSAKSPGLMGGSQGGIIPS